VDDLGLVFLKKGIELIVSPQVFLNGAAGIISGFALGGFNSGVLAIGPTP
jgi:hypothetical protein